MNSLIRAIFLSAGAFRGLVIPNLRASVIPGKVRMHVQSELARILGVVRPQRVKGRQYMTEKDTIQVLVLDADEALPGRRMIPGAGAVSARVVDMSMDAVKKGIQTVTEQISEIVRDMPANSGPASLDGISVDLSVSADGSVQWVVGLGVAVSSTVSLTFKVSDVANDGKET